MFFDYNHGYKRGIAFGKKQERLRWANTVADQRDEVRGLKKKLDKSEKKTDDTIDKQHNAIDSIRTKFHKREDALRSREQLCEKLLAEFHGARQWFNLHANSKAQGLVTLSSQFDSKVNDFENRLQEIQEKSAAG